MKMTFKTGRQDRCLLSSGLEYRLTEVHAAVSRHHRYLHKLISCQNQAAAASARISNGPGAFVSLTLFNRVHLKEKTTSSTSITSCRTEMYNACLRGH